MRKWLSTSMLALAGLLSLPAAGQVVWDTPFVTFHQSVEFLWLDNYDSTLYVCGGGIQSINGQPAKWGFTYRKGVVGRLPFEDSLRGSPAAMARYNGKLYVSDGYQFGSYDPVNGWAAVIPYIYQPPFTNDVAIYCIYKYGNQLLLGGQFQNLNGTNATTLALFDGTSFTDFHRADTVVPYSWFVFSIVAYKGKVVVAGNIDVPNGVKEIAQWDGQRWDDMNGGIGGGGMEDVASMVVIGDDLYVGGLFDEASGGPGNNVARWDGANWHRLGAGVSPTGAIRGMIAIGDTLAVTGTFTRVDGQKGYNYARYYKGRWCANTDSFDNQAGSIINYYDTIMVGGGFRHIGGLPNAYLARIRSQSDCMSTVGVDDLQSSESPFAVSLAPNPATEQVTVSYTAQQAGTVFLSLVDPVGKSVMNKQLRVQAGRNTFRLSLQDLAPGCYHLSISSGSGKAYGRLLKL